MWRLLLVDQNASCGNDRLLDVGGVCESSGVAPATKYDRSGTAGEHIRRGE